MMKKNRIYLRLLIAFAILLLIPTWTLAGDDWKEGRKAIWSQLQVKPGDKIDKTNWQKVENLLPPSVLEWVKTGDLYFTIGELEDDFTADRKWIDPTVEPTGQYALDDKQQLIDKSTGEYPLHVVSMPFPDMEIDWKNDPYAGYKIIYNFDSQTGRIKSYDSGFLTNFVSRDKGAYRYYDGRYYSFYYQYNPDVPNPEKLNRAILVAIDKPVAGVVQLTNRYLSEQDDNLWAYVPAIRRVKKLSGASRSDPFGGSDFVSDDGSGWEGKATSMKWKVLDKKIVLVPFHEKNMGKHVKMIEQPDGSWLHPDWEPDMFVKPGVDYTDWTGAPWMPVNVKYTPLELYVIEATPVDKYYNYGVQIFYMHQIGAMQYKIINNKAGELWKTLQLISVLHEHGNGAENVLRPSAQFYGVHDHRSDHASISWGGVYNRGDFKGKVRYESKAVPLSMFNPSQISQLSR